MNHEIRSPRVDDPRAASPGRRRTRRSLGSLGALSGCAVFAVCAAFAAGTEFDPEDPRPAAAPADVEVVPHAAAVALVADREREEIARIDGGLWWHDVMPRTFTVARPFYPGGFDTTHDFEVSYARSGRVLGRWSVNTERGEVHRSKAGDVPTTSLLEDLALLSHQERIEGGSLLTLRPSSAAREAAARVLARVDVRGWSAEEIGYLLGRNGVPVPGEGAVEYRFGEQQALTIRVRFDGSRAVEAVLRP